jgi:hypothetical protein
VCATCDALPVCATRGVLHVCATCDVLPVCATCDVLPVCATCDVLLPVYGTCDGSRWLHLRCGFTVGPLGLRLTSTYQLGTSQPDNLCLVLSNACVVLAIALQGASQSTTMKEDFTPPPMPDFKGDGFTVYK